MNNREYWNRKAKVGTFPDVHLREKEIEEITRTIARFKPKTFVDLGCGDGYSTKKFARRFPGIRFLGMDYSEEMIRKAKRSGPANAAFEVADVLSFRPSTRYDMASTCRCLINLKSAEDQMRALRNISALLKRGGIFVMLESFVEGYVNLNRLRRKYGLHLLVPHEQNLYFSRNVDRQTSSFFNLVEISEFSSSYYFGSRIAYPLLCRKLEHGHAVNKLFTEMPPTQGFGREVLTIYRNAHPVHVS